jgi:peptidoglycan/LPS O-acetylase OafA/YrhL
VAAPPTTRSRHQRFRPDIEGLRAVAVLGVVFYHAGVGFLPGGFVGVDVFYVISGFLITDLLWRETDRSGRVDFKAFYARRARRLLPASIVVIVATIAWSAAVLPPLDLRSVWQDGLYCAVYIGNFRFAATGTNYLADITPSPFQHFWSLGVEEQFYLLWPLLLVAASLAWRRSRPSRGFATLGLTMIVAISLFLSVQLTRSNQPVAFFLLPSRAWELAVGGLVALGSPALRRLPTEAGAFASWAGVAAILLACFSFGAHTAFPGYAAALPVGGAALVIAGGLVTDGRGATRVLGHSGMRAVGRISYSWYLWHYPVLVLVPIEIGHHLSVAAMSGLALGSGLLAVLTFRFVEEPGRRARWMTASPTHSLSAGLALSAAGILACAGAAWSIPSLHGHGQAPVAVIHPPGTTSHPGAPVAADPVLTALAADRRQVVAAVAASATERSVPANLSPPLSAASASEAPPMVDGCLLSYKSSSVAYGCLFGDTTASRSIVLFGDSHAAMWFPAVDAWANANSYRLYVWTKAACPPVRITLFSPVLNRTWTECTQWYSEVISAISSTHPAMVVIGIAPNYDAAYDVVQNGGPWLSGLSSTVTSIRQAGARVVVLGSTPSPPQSIPDCLSGRLDDIPGCQFSPVGQRVSGGGLVGVDQAGNRAESASVTSAGGQFLDLVPLFCTPAVCDVVVDNVLVFRDNSHVTVTYANYLSPLIGAQMTATLSKP